jgi:hypothetical protein
MLSSFGHVFQTVVKHWILVCIYGSIWIFITGILKPQILEYIHKCVANIILSFKQTYGLFYQFSMALAKAKDIKF